MTPPDNFQACERGNTWLTNGENHLAYFDIPNSTQRIEVAYSWSLC